MLESTIECDRNDVYAKIVDNSLCANREVRGNHLCQNVLFDINNEFLDYVNITFDDMCNLIEYDKYTGHSGSIEGEENTDIPPSQICVEKREFVFKFRNIEGNVEVELHFRIDNKERIAVELENYSHIFHYFGKACYWPRVNITGILHRRKCLSNCKNDNICETDNLTCFSEDHLSTVILINESLVKETFNNDDKLWEEEIVQGYGSLLYNSPITIANHNEQSNVLQSLKFTLYIDDSCELLIMCVLKENKYKREEIIADGDNVSNTIGTNGNENVLNWEAVAVYTHGESSSSLDNNGASQYYHTIISVKHEWTSLVTFNTYPTEFSINVPMLHFSCVVKALFQHQEVVTPIASNGAFYEGVVQGDGSMKGELTNIKGFVIYRSEEACYNASNILCKVNQVVRTELERVYPLHADFNWIKDNILNDLALPNVDGIAPQVLCDILFKPVRLLIDRGGKSWRSLLMISCCNALSETYFDCEEYIAMFELLHVGSLIIDDVEDNSYVRRGQECVHLSCGTPTAINAGTFCYFMALRLVRTNKLSLQIQLKINNLLNDLMRIGHIGQGLDIHGLSYLIPEMLKTNNVEPLRQAILTIHTFKTSAIVAAICEIACVLCNKGKTLTDAMKKFGNKIGLAYQIIDDVLDITGFQNSVKECGKDIRDHKITYPIMETFALMTIEEKHNLWKLLQEQNMTDENVCKVVNEIKQTGALNECLQKAKELAKEGWRELDELLDESTPKNLLRMLCTLLTERKY